jgi:hypothetical protein
MATRFERQLLDLPGVREAVKTKAKQIQATARSLAGGHGGLAADIGLEYPNAHDIDVVMSHDHALSIEVGHWDKARGSGWVPGLHIMRDAAAAHKQP